MIRTRDPLLPKQMLYQAELHPDARIDRLQLSRRLVKSATAAKPPDLAFGLLRRAAGVENWVPHPVPGLDSEPPGRATWHFEHGRDWSTRRDDAL
jgi:hypothetical protein